MATEALTGRWGALQRAAWREPGVPVEGWCADDVVGVDWGDMKVLVIGAGGLGCEILKNLALMGFKDLEVIDMDTVDLSNLNRQFLFREKDIGQPKATAAAGFVMKRVPGCEITPHFGRIEDKPNSFYMQFCCIILGLDSLDARRWVNAKVCELTEWELAEDGKGAVVRSTIPLVDGGTEGFKGHARVVEIGRTACIESTEWMFPPQITFPMCTLENVPRLPEHCVEYVKVKTWDDEWPFGRNVRVDGDNPDHIMWIANKAAERGAKHDIAGITYQFTQGVVKNIVPAIASTNAIIAAACCNEVFKMATSCNPILNNYFMYNGNSIDHGVYGQVQSFPADETCAVSRPPTLIACSRGLTPREFVDKHLLNSPAVMNANYEQYADATALTLQSVHCGVLLAPKTSIIAAEVAKPFADLDVDDDGDGAPILIASDPTFWGKGTLKILLKFED